MLRRIFTGILLLAGLVLIAGLFLPRQYRVERAGVIRAPSRTAYNLVSNPSLWYQWNPWFADQDMKAEFSGEKEGKGAVMHWRSRRSSSGSMTVTGARPGEFLVMEFIFPGRKKGMAIWHFRTRADQTLVSWSFEGETGNNILMRYLGLFMDRITGDQMEKGLESLNRAAMKNYQPHGG